MAYNKVPDPATCKGCDPGVAPENYVSFCFLRNIQVAIIRYLKLKHDTFGVL